MSEEGLFVDKFTGNLAWSISLASALTLILISALGILTTTNMLMRMLAYVLIFSTYAGIARVIMICVRIVLTNMEKEAK